MIPPGRLLLLCFANAVTEVKAWLVYFSVVLAISHVAAVADGLKAWEKLKGRPHNVDLILTEVELPSISGYALLTLIMEHDICKNIPVIMMSSQDSISLVIKCVSRGAADFLIKPIRKNELKNLWQHVWRRQIGRKNVPKFNDVASEKDVGSFEDNRAKDHSSDKLASAGRNKRSREKCSDSQSSCDKPYLDAETSSMPDGLCKVRVKLENGSSMSDTGKHGVSSNMVDKSAVRKSDPGALSTEGNDQHGEEVASHHGPPISVITGLQEDHTCVKPRILPDSLDEKAYVANESNWQASTLTQHASGAVDMIGKFDGRSEDFSGNSHDEVGPKKVDITPELDLSLRQMHHGHPQDERTEQCILHPSRASAFSRYKNSRGLQPPFPISTSNFSLPKEDLGSSHQQIFNQFPAFVSSPERRPVPSQSQDYRTAFVLGQSELPKEMSSGAQLGFVPIPNVRFDSAYSIYGYPYPPIYYVQPVFPSFWSEKSHHEESSLPASSSIRSSSEVNNPEPSFHLNNTSTHHFMERTSLPDSKQLEVAKTDRDASPPLYLSNDLTRNETSPVAGTLCSMNEGNDVLATTAARPTESVNDNSHLVYDGMQGKYSQCTSQREAALLKFRMKRKGRCYDKKVRYQSRKRLAEQRPRVKGQFTRQVQNETSPLDAGHGSPSYVHNT